MLPWVDFLILESVNCAIFSIFGAILMCIGDQFYISI